MEQRVVVDYYTKSFSEHERHLDGFGQIQQTRTLQLLQRYLKPTDKIIDIGGATGVYSFALARLGHDVHLLDLVPLHVEKAKKISEESGIHLSGYHVGDAQNLSFPDSSFDSVILHGPLYHITDKECRLRVLKEAFRVLKPEGKIFAFAINRYAGLFYGIHSELILDDSYFSMISKEVKTGFRDRTPLWHFHLPEEMEQEVACSGFENIETKGVVGPIWMLPNVEEKLTEELTKQQVLRVSELVENEPIIGQDFVCIGIKSTVQH